MLLSSLLRSVLLLGLMLENQYGSGVLHGHGSNGQILIHLSRIANVLLHIRTACKQEMIIKEGRGAARTLSGILCVCTSEALGKAL